jgi:hypothetical protein
MICPYFTRGSGKADFHMDMAEFYIKTVSITKGWSWRENQTPTLKRITIKIAF